MGSLVEPVLLPAVAQTIKEANAIGRRSSATLRTTCRRMARIDEIVTGPFSPVRAGLAMKKGSHQVGSLARSLADLHASGLQRDLLRLSSS